MQTNIRHLVWTILLVSFTSMVYYLSLLIHLPVYIVAAVIAVFGFFSFRWFGKNVVVDEQMPPVNVKWAAIIFIAGVAVIANKSFYIEQKYGNWDAWYIWDYHAKFMLHPDGLKLIKTLPYIYHPDYPLFISSFIAFVWRLFNTNSALVPFSFSFFVTLMIPVITFLSLYRKNLVVASIVFFLLALDELYLDHGLAQYADLPLGLILLTTLICFGEQKEKSNFNIAVTAALLGSAMWIKNEGILLSFVFVVFNFRALATRGHWKYFLAGISLPLITLCLFKSTVPATDLVAGQSTEIFKYLVDPARYKIVFDYLFFDFNHYFVVLKIAFALYVIFCFVEKKPPTRNMWMLLCCCTGFFFVYITIPVGLEWRLQTSMDRLIMQMMPSFLYVIALGFTRIKMSLGAVSDE